MDNATTKDGKAIENNEDNQNYDNDDVNNNNNNNNADDEGTCFGTQVPSLQVKWLNGQGGTLATPRHKWW